MCHEIEIILYNNRNDGPVIFDSDPCEKVFYPKFVIYPTNYFDKSIGLKFSLQDLFNQTLNILFKKKQSDNTVNINLF